MDAKTAKRKLTALKRKRHSRTRSGPCIRCGGYGGWKGWPGFTCYRCGGHNSMHHEVWTERYWPTPELEAEAAGLVEIIRADEEEKARIRNEAALREQKERDHEAALREDAWREEKARKPFLGEPGQRIDVEAEVVFVKDIATRFGTCLLVLFKDEATGAVLKTFGTAECLWSLGKGDRVAGKATVKDHEVYQGEKQTVITRAKLEKREA